VRPARAASVLLLLGLLVGGAVAQRGRTGARGADLRSILIYPEERIALRMDHSLPEHRALRCIRCHEDAERSERATDSLLPAERTCLPCHAGEMDRAGSGDRCRVCHVDHPGGAGSAVASSSLPPARLHFSHRLHVRAGTRCLSCHEGADQATVATRSHLPTMRSCFECHGARGQTASTECVTCHLSRADGRLVTRFPEGTMNPPRWLRGMHHDSEWMVRHRWVGADSGPLCASCHSEQDCEDCHDGRVRPRRAHPNDFLTVHPQVARRNDSRCQTCHQEQTFCAECHARLGLAQISAPSARATARFHPPGDVWVGGPAQHATEARRAMSACASCHVERDCVQCHGALGIGSGFSPHGPGFLSRCRTLLRQNARACITCHGEVEALRSRCR
jgi:hypothetical protein